VAPVLKTEETTMKSLIVRNLLAALTIATFTMPGPAAAAKDRPAGDVGWMGAFLAADEKGARLEAVIRDGPADKAGLRAGDVVTQADGKSIHSPGELGDLVRDAGPGKDIAVKFTRDGKEDTVTVKAAAWPQWFGPSGFGGWGFWSHGPQRWYQAPPDLRSRVEKEMERLRKELNELRQRFEKYMSDKQGSRI
jgi:hypothetical protein